MPPKTHRAGLPRTHSRSSSGGSSRALNLYFTQKDPAPVKQVEKTKKNGLVHDSHPRNTSPRPSRVNSSARLASREHLPAQPQRPPSIQRHTTGKPKTGFTLNQSADEDDEWVSSESGAATPNSALDTERSRTPVEPNAPPIEEPILRPETPTAQLPRVPTVRPPSATMSATRLEPSSISQHSHEQRIMETRSENTSPIHRSHPHKRHSVTRPPSTHSTASRIDPPLRPHPLIRGQSYGHIAPVTPRMEPLAPLTITSEAAPAQLSTSPPHGVEDKLSTSPSSIKTTHAPSYNRRTSVSSTCSVVTLPTAHIQPHFKVVHDRTRTLSSISSHSSGSIQVLSSLAQLPTTRPSTPQYTSHFPAASLYANLEAVHPLLPPPYLSAHMSILAHRSPLREAYDRVTVAKEQQRRAESAWGVRTGAS